MTWLTFSTYLIVGYVVYYTLNILFDLLKSPPSGVGEVETLVLSDETETIEVDDMDNDDTVITTNRFRTDTDTHEPNHEEIKKIEIEPAESDEQIIPSTVEVEISEKGGLSLKSLTEMYRLQAIQESNQMPFAY